MEGSFSVGLEEVTIKVLVKSGKFGMHGVELRVGVMHTVAC